MTKQVVQVLSSLRCLSKAELVQIICSGCYIQNLLPLKLFLLQETRLLSLVTSGPVDGRTSYL